MYPKNRIPMYEGDGFIRPNPIQDTAESSSLPVPNRDSESRVEPGLRLSGAARNLLRKLAVLIGSSVRHLQTRALER